MSRDLIEEVRCLNARQVRVFAEQQPNRTRRRSQHPTEIVIIQCADGRVCTATAAQVPEGIVTEMREIGGQFDPASPIFHSRLLDILRFAQSRGRQVLIWVIYHFSEEDPELGCAGHGCNRETARRCAERLTQTINVELLDGRHDLARAITVGYETDEDVFLMHEAEGRHVVSMTNLLDAGEGALREICLALYPDMSGDMIEDLIPLMAGNIRHVQEIRSSGRGPQRIDHREVMIAIGSQLGWLTRGNRNYALALSDKDPTQLPVMVQKAARLILESRYAGRIDIPHSLLFSQVPYSLVGEPPELHTFLQKQALLQARRLAEVGMDAIRRAFPSDIGVFRGFIATLDRNTQALTQTETL